MNLYIEDITAKTEKQQMMDTKGAKSGGVNGSATYLQMRSLCQRAVPHANHLVSTLAECIVMRHDDHAVAVLMGQR